MSHTQNQTGTPALVINTQYARDLVFHVPEAPAIYTMQNLRPHVAVNVDVQLRQLSQAPAMFEVALVIGANALAGAPAEGQPAPAQAYTIELAYCAVVTVTVPSPEMAEPLLMVECPRMLFPFARSVLADMTREAGFAPLVLQPLDFVALWQSRRASRDVNRAADSVAAAS